MELALYCPVYGYYEKEADTVGRRGDFYTSVSVGPLFGELLALQFSQWLDQLSDAHAEAVSQSRPTAKLSLVEAGAHKGDLARDILVWLRQQRPDLLKSVEYVVVEPSAVRQNWQRQTLESFPEVGWVDGIEKLPPTTGIIFSNELLDAFPVHRWFWDAPGHAWREWRVSFEAGQLVWVRPDAIPTQHNESSRCPSWPEEILSRLPDGFVTETSAAAEEWWANAARVLRKGRLLTIDYGLTPEEKMAPERLGGTLRAYKSHAPAADVLANPGEQDLTAHIDLGSLSQIGEGEGLRTETLTSQEQFLTRIAAAVLKSDVQFGAWTAQRTRQFQTLTHPGHLGRAFRVLVQAR